MEQISTVSQIILFFSLCFLWDVHSTFHMLDFTPFWLQELYYVMKVCLHAVELSSSQILDMKIPWLSF